MRFHGDTSACDAGRLARHAVGKNAPGNVVDYAYVLAKIEEIAATYRVEEIAIDPAMSAGVVTQMQDLGLPVVLHRQGWASMPRPVPRW